MNAAPSLTQKRPPQSPQFLSPSVRVEHELLRTSHSLTEHVDFFPMTASIKPLSKRTAWKNLAAHYKKIKEVPLSKLFADDPKRGQRLTTEAAGLFLDYSKNRVTGETVKLLVQLAVESDLRGRIGAMFSGEKINITEKRAVLHVALRAPKNASILVDGKDVVPEVHSVLDAMSAFANRVRSGAWKGHTGKRIRNIVNIGIGGSDLGP